MGRGEGEGSGVLGRSSMGSWERLRWGLGNGALGRIEVLGRCEMGSWEGAAIESWEGLWWGLGKD